MGATRIRAGSSTGKRTAGR